MKDIYLDYAATTPVDSRVREAMDPYFGIEYGNPSSLHSFGQQAQAALDRARGIVAGALGADPGEIIFTSSGTESSNLALRGAALARREEGGCQEILISEVEHPSVLATVRQLEDLHGFQVTRLAVDPTGQVNPDQLEGLLNPGVAVVSVMASNNEVGTLNPVAEIGKLCRRRGIPFHSDAVQSAAHYPLDVNQLQVDLLSLGGHKMYAPKGVGALYVRSGTTLYPSQTGGSQEFGLRAATENIPYIAAFSRAIQLIKQEASHRQAALEELRDEIIIRVLEEVPDARLTGAPPPGRLPNHASFVFLNLDGNLLVQVLDAEGYAVSSGSACKTGDPSPSSVLTSLGYKPEWSLGSLRVSLGKDTTREDVEGFLQILPDCIRRVREMDR